MKLILLLLCGSASAVKVRSSLRGNATMVQPAAYDPVRALCMLGEDANNKPNIVPWCAKWVKCIQSTAAPKEDAAAVKKAWDPASCKEMCGAWPASPSKIAAAVEAAAAANKATAAAAAAQAAAAKLAQAAAEKAAKAKAAAKAAKEAAAKAAAEAAKAKKDKAADAAEKAAEAAKAAKAAAAAKAKAAKEKAAREKAARENALRTARAAAAAAAAAEAAKAAAMPQICAAKEGETCTCSGRVWFGRKFAAGKPGSGGLVSFEAMKSAGTKHKTVFDSVQCSNGAFGGDPANGFYKHCYCESLPPPVVCAAKEGDTCSCAGNVYYGRKFEDNKPGNGRLADFFSMKTSTTRQKRVFGSVQCSNREFRDPVPGYYKRCFCETPPPPAVCAAKEGETCTCSGRVYFGKKFASGKPGNGNLLGFNAMKSGGTKEKTVSGSVQCSNSKFGDPTPGFYKHCYCDESAPPPNICAVAEGDTCSCSGKVYFGRKFANGKPGSGGRMGFERMVSAGTRQKTVAGSVKCSNGNFGGGDPAPGFYKHCYCEQASTFLQVAPPALSFLNLNSKGDCENSCAALQTSLSTCVATIVFDSGKLSPSSPISKGAATQDPICSQKDSPCLPDLPIRHQKCLRHSTAKVLDASHKVADEVSQKCKTIAGQMEDCKDCPQLNDNYNTHYAGFVGGCMDQLHSYWTATNARFAGFAALPAEKGQCKVHGE